MKKVGSWYNIVLVIVIIASLALLFFQNISAITGHAVGATTTSNVSIQYYLAINPSPELQAGIVFEDIVILPMVDDNATQNYAGADNSTLYYINVSADSNTPVRFCIMASGNMSNGVEEIPLEGETYVSNVTTSDFNTPSMADEASLNITYQIAADNVPIGNTSYWRFWLDVPAGQGAGEYSNTITFKGVTAGQGCGA